MRRGMARREAPAAADAKLRRATVANCMVLAVEAGVQYAVQGMKRAANVAFANSCGVRQL